MPYIRATETWIRERVGLSHDAVVDVTRLLLPGPGTVKICELGRSLLCFTSLRQLDLSNNALTTLDGMAQLKKLEVLNLYNNNIGDLREVFLLHHNVKLKELDLRLNPITVATSEYRLFVVHMLVHLRRLDQRSVRGKERQAALQHFSPEEALGMAPKVTLSTSNEGDMPDSKPATKRTELVRSLAAHPSALEEDVVALIDEVHLSRGDLSKLPILTGSVGRIHQASVQIPQEDMSDSVGRSLRLSAFRPTVCSSKLDLQPTTCTERQLTPRLRYNPANAAAPYHVCGNATHRPPSKDDDDGSCSSDQQGSTDDAAYANVVVLNDYEQILDQLIAVVLNQTQPTPQRETDERTFTSGAVYMLGVDQRKHLRGQLLHLILEKFPAASRCDQAVSTQPRITPGDKTTVCSKCPQTDSKLAETTGKMEALYSQMLQLKARTDATEAALQTANQRKSSLKHRIKDLQEALADGQAAKVQLVDLRRAVTTLQESQVALVNNNDRLLLETHEMRRNHQLQLQQLHRSYEQLRGLKSISPGTGVEFGSIGRRDGEPKRTSVDNPG